MSPNHSPALTATKSRTSTAESACYYQVAAARAPGVAVLSSTMGRVNGMAGEPGVVLGLDCLASLRNEAWPGSWDLGTLESLSRLEDPKQIRGPSLFPPRAPGTQGRWFKNQGVPRLKMRFTLNLVPDPSSQTRLKVSRPISLSERPAGPWILPKVVAVQQAAAKPTLHRQIWDGLQPTPRAQAGIPHPSSRHSPLLRPPTEPTPTPAPSTMAS